jgi:putative transposase
VERNAVRAGLPGTRGRAEDWRWSSLWRSRQPDPQRIDGSPQPLALTDWPIPGGRPKHWLRTVNTPLTDDELQTLRRAVQRNQPYGSAPWLQRQVNRFHLESTLRPPGRPKGPTPS